VTVIVVASPAVIVPCAALTNDRLALGASAVPVARNRTGLPLRPVDVASNVSGPATVPRIQLPTTAIPLALVVWLAPVTLPLCADEAKVTATPATGFPFASFTITDGAGLTAVFTVATSPLCSPAMLAAFPAVPVATNVTGLPVRPTAVAVTVSTFAWFARVQLVTAAMPLAAVVGMAPVMVPFVVPRAANVTATPATGLPCASLTITEGGIATEVPALAVWLFPPFKAIVVALPCVAVAVKLTGEPASPVTVAVAPCAPAVVPRTRVAVAIPVAAVTDDGVIEPPPVTAHATVIPETGLPPASVTFTLYGIARVAPMVSVWASPPFRAMLAAAPVVMLKAVLV
jgi:hypothetical protein